METKYQNVKKKNIKLKKIFKKHTKIYIKKF